MNKNSVASKTAPAHKGYGLMAGCQISIISPDFEMPSTARQAFILHFDKISFDRLTKYIALFLIDKYFLPVFLIAHLVALLKAQISAETNCRKESETTVLSRQRSQ
jgi:hypothetical protein